MYVPDDLIYIYIYTQHIPTQEMYQMITLGGDAELELVDTLDPFSEAAPQSNSIYIHV